MITFIQYDIQTYGIDIIPIQLKYFSRGRLLLIVVSILYSLYKNNDKWKSHTTT